jgi:hypothetical protein
MLNQLFAAERSNRTDLSNMQVSQNNKTREVSSSSSPISTPSPILDAPVGAAGGIPKVFYQPAARTDLTLVDVLTGLTGRTAQTAVGGRAVGWKQPREFFQHTRESECRREEFRMGYSMVGFRRVHARSTRAQRLAVRTGVCVQLLRTSEDTPSRLPAHGLDRVRADASNADVHAGASAQKITGAQTQQSTTTTTAAPEPVF